MKKGAYSKMRGKGKIFLTAVALILLAGLLCGFTRAPLPEEQRLLLDHLDGLLAFSEGVHVQMRQALDRAEEFTKDNTWDSLLKARAACYSAKSWLRKLELPEFTLTDPQYEALLAAGIEADAIRREYQGLEVTRSAFFNSVNSLTAMLEKDVFLSASVSAFPLWIESLKGILAAESEYLCATANYLLLQLDERGLWEKMPGAYPCISEEMQAFDSDPASLMEKSAAALNRYEKQFEKLTEYSATSEYTMSIVQEAAGTGELARLSKQLHTVAGVPGYIPLPYWFSADVESVYCVKDPGTGELRRVKAGEAVAQSPAACYLSCGEISREDVDAYVRAMSALGYTVSESEKDGTCLARIADGECTLFVQWTPAKTVLYQRQPMACLIPALYFDAMRQN